MDAEEYVQSLTSKSDAELIFLERDMRSKISNPDYGLMADTLFVYGSIQKELERRGKLAESMSGEP